MTIALTCAGLVGFILGYHWAKEVIHREHVARGCWMVRNSIERTE